MYREVRQPSKNQIEPPPDVHTRLLNLTACSVGVDILFSMCTQISIEISSINETDWHDTRCELMIRRLCHGHCVFDGYSSSWRSGLAANSLASLALKSLSAVILAVLVGLVSQLFPVHLLNVTN